MIDIRIAGESLDLFPNTSIPLNLVNPIFSEVGTHSLSFELPKTDKNKKLLDFAHRLELLNNVTDDFEVMIYIAHMEWLKGLLTVKETSTSYSVYFCSENGSFNKKTNALYLPDVDLGDDIVAATNMIAHAKSVSAGTYPTQSHCFPVIYNPNFYGENKESNLAYNSVINSYDPTNEIYRINDINITPNTDNKYALSPQFYLFFILDKLFSHLGYLYSGSFFEDTDLAKLIVYNHYALDFTQEKYFVSVTGTSQTFTMSDLISLGGWGQLLLATEVSDVDSIYNTSNSRLYCKIGSVEIITSVRIQVINNPGTNVLVRLRLRKYDPSTMIFLTIGDEVTDTWVQDENDARTFNFTRTAFNTSDESTHNSYFYLDISLTFGDEFTYVIIDNKTLKHYNHSASSLNIFNNTITPTNHVPNILSSTVLNAIRKTFGIHYFISEVSGKIEFKFLSEIIDDIEYIDITNKVSAAYIKTIDKDAGLKFNFTFPAGDADVSNIKEITTGGTNDLGDFDKITDLPAPSKAGDIAYVWNLNAYYIVKQDDANLMQWVLLTFNFPDYIVGTGATEVKPNLSTLFQFVHNHPTEGYCCPQTKQKGTSPAFDTGINALELQLLFYWGFQENASAETYPYASHLAYDYAKTSMGNYELRWGGTKGLYAKFWQKYSEWFVNRKVPVTYYAILDVEFLRNLKWYRKYRINNVNFYISSIEVEATMNGLSLAKLQLYKA